MSNSDKRDEWDQHNRDEAKERAAQQEAAGSAFRPVLAAPYASLGGSPAGSEAPLDAAPLVDEYERATVAERRAWLAVRDVIAHEPDADGWNAWRDAVERTQLAVRSLVNYETARSARS